MLDLSKEMVVSHPILTDEELNQLRPTLAPGYYKALVTNAEGKTSKATSSPMLVLTLQIWDRGGKSFEVKHFILLTEAWSHVIKRFWESAAQPENYQKKDLKFKDYMQKEVWVKTKLQDNMDGSSKVAAIVSYVREDKVPQEFKAGMIESSPELNDDVPF